MNVTPQQALQTYLAIKLHFDNPKYDFFRYSGKTRSVDITKRKDRFLFNKLAKLVDSSELVLFLAANAAVNKKFYVTDLLSDEAQSNFIAFKRYQESFTYIFTEELCSLYSEHGDLRELLKCRDGFFPPILKLVLSGKLKIQTFIALNEVIDFFPMFDKNIQEDILWPALKVRCEKLKPFLALDKQKIGSVLKSKVKEYESTPIGTKSNDT